MSGPQTFSDYLNWFSLVGPGLVMCKDGSFLAAWELTGADLESCGKDEMAVQAKNLVHAMHIFGDGDGLWVDLARRPTRGYHASPEDYEHPALRVIDIERKARFADLGGHFANSLTLTYQHKPRSNDTNLAALCQVVEERMRDVQSRLSAVYGMRRLKTVSREISDYGETAEQDELVGRLASAVSGRFRNVNVPEIPVYLDVVVRPEFSHPFVKRLPEVGGRPAAIIGVDGLRSTLTVGALSVLERLPLEYQWTTRFLPMKRETAQGHIEGRKRGWQMKRRGISSQITSKGGDAAVNMNAVGMADECDVALAEVDEGTLRYGSFTSTISLFGTDGADDEESVREQARIVVEALQETGFDARIETYNAAEAFVGSLPGHQRQNVRRPTINSLNFAHLIPMNSVWSGYSKSPHPRFPKGTPALLRARTSTGEPYFFNLHSGDVGHSLIIGPTGGGKSVLLSLLVLGFMRVKGAQVFVFDKGYSMLGFCRVAGGTHVELGSDGQALAPLSGLKDMGLESGIDWITLFALRHGIDLTPQLRRGISDTIQVMAELGETSLKSFGAQIQNQDLRDALAPYLDGASVGKFDGDKDSFDLSDLTVFETAALGSGVTPVRSLTLDYVFRRINHRLTGRPTLIIIDEAWAFLKDPLFADRIEEWLRTLRRQNAALVMATQGIEDAGSSTIIDVLRTNVPTKIYLPNPGALGAEKKGSYQSVGLTDRQIEIISNLQPKRDYYISKPEGHRIVDFFLGDIALALMGATDEAAVRAMNEAWRADPLNFWIPYVEAVVPGINIKRRVQ